MAKAKENLEAKCKKAILTVPEIRDILQDINLKLTHIIEYGKDRFYARRVTRDIGEYNHNGDQYTRNGDQYLN